MSMGYKIRNWTEDDYKKIGEMYRAGETLSSIGRYFGVSKDTIKKRLKEIGLRR